jgi:hypothetical protein
MARSVLLVMALLSVAVEQARADHIVYVIDPNVLYNNGSINAANPGGNPIFGVGGQTVTDSFTLANTSNLTGAQLGLYIPGPSGNTPTTVQWSIGTTPFASDQGSGTASLTNTLFFSSTLYASSFPLSQQLASGTYWLTIQNATPPAGVGVYWSQNFGPSSSFVAGSGVNGSESFEIFGTEAAASPEPASITLFGIGIAGLAGYSWRSRAKNCRSTHHCCELMKLSHWPHKETPPTA